MRSINSRYTWLNGFALYDAKAGQEIAELVANGHSLRGAAGGVNLTFSSVLRWLQEYPDFALLIEEAHARKVFQTEGLIFNEINPVRHKTQLTLLARAAPEAWDSTVLAQQEDPINQININVISAPSPPMKTEPESDHSVAGTSLINPNIKLN
jgi:hypothetical protein